MPTTHQRDPGSVPVRAPHPCWVAGPPVDVEPHRTSPPAQRDLEFVAASVEAGILDREEAGVGTGTSRRRPQKTAENWRWLLKSFLLL